MQSGIFSQSLLAISLQNITNYVLWDIDEPNHRQHLLATLASCLINTANKLSNYESILCKTIQTMCNLIVFPSTITRKQIATLSSMHTPYVSLSEATAFWIVHGSHNLPLMHNLCTNNKTTVDFFQ